MPTIQLIDSKELNRVLEPKFMPNVKILANRPVKKMTA
ncbi:MAG: hypothetical protein RIT27_931 [Pseudomonadota bacterium]|jgi:hypothetical protein